LSRLQIQKRFGAEIFMSNTVYIAADAGPDLAAIINAALADPNVSTVVLGEGVFVIDSPIVVPSDCVCAV
jgi:hypothetical protein